MKPIRYGAAFIIAISLSWNAPAQDLITVTNWMNTAYQEMVKQLGPPICKTGYTIRTAPTKSWNHKELFAIYPKEDRNLDVQIMDVTWDEGDTQLMANFHIVNGTNLCFLAKRMKKEIQF